MNTFGLVLAIIGYSVALGLVVYRFGYRKGALDGVEACQKIVDSLTEDLKQLANDARSTMSNSQQKHTL